MCHLTHEPTASCGGMGQPVRLSRGACALLHTSLLPRAVARASLKGWPGERSPCHTRASRLPRVVAPAAAAGPVSVCHESALSGTASPAGPCHRTRQRARVQQGTRSPAQPQRPVPPHEAAGWLVCGMANALRPSLTGRPMPPHEASGSHAARHTLTGPAAAAGPCHERQRARMWHCACSTGQPHRPACATRQRAGSCGACPHQNTRARCLVRCHTGRPVRLGR